MPDLAVIDGARLEYRSIDGVEPALVFLHEGLGSIDLWRSFPEALCRATGRRGLIYSRQGHGWSDSVNGPRDPDFMHNEALAVLPALLAELEVASPILVGHSDGASIAIIHAGASHPVAGLVLLSPHVFVEERSIEGIEAALDRFERTDLSERMAKYHSDPESTFRAWNDTWLDTRFRDWNIEEFLPGIDCPVLLVQGLDDEYGTLAQIEAIGFGVRGPVQRLVLPDCGHSPHLDRPDEVIAAAAGFVNVVGEVGL